MGRRREEEIKEKKNIPRERDKQGRLTTTIRTSILQENEYTGEKKKDKESKRKSRMKVVTPKLEKSTTEGFLSAS